MAGPCDEGLVENQPPISPLHTTFDLAREAIEEEQSVKFDLCPHCTGEQNQIDGTRLGLQAEIAFHSSHSSRHPVAKVRVNLICSLAPVCNILT